MPLPLFFWDGCRGVALPGARPGDRRLLGLPSVVSWGLRQSLPNRWPRLKTPIPAISCKVCWSLSMSSNSFNAPKNSPTTEHLEPPTRPGSTTNPSIPRRQHITSSFSNKTTDMNMSRKTPSGNPTSKPTRTIA